MTEPLHDPTVAGYIEAVPSTKDDANQAKPATALFDNLTFVKWFKRGVWVVLAVIVIIVGSCAYKANQAHKAEVAKIEAAPEAGIPASEKPTITRKKVATKTIANNSSNTPQTVDLVPEKQVSKPVNSDGFTSEFDKKLVEFERKIPK